MWIHIYHTTGSYGIWGPYFLWICQGFSSDLPWQDPFGGRIKIVKRCGQRSAVAFATFLMRLLNIRNDFQYLLDEPRDHCSSMFLLDVEMFLLGMWLSIFLLELGDHSPQMSTDLGPLDPQLVASGWFWSKSCTDVALDHSSYPMTDPVANGRLMRIQNWGILMVNVDPYIYI